MFEPRADVTGLPRYEEQIFSPEQLQRGYGTLQSLRRLEREKAFPVIAPMEFTESLFWYHYGPKAVGVNVEVTTAAGAGGKHGISIVVGPGVTGAYPYVGAGYGGSYGFSFEVFLAWGEGSWSGVTQELQGNYSWFTFGMFESPNWQGLTLGFSYGYPFGLYYGRTIYPPP